MCCKSGANIWKIMEGLLVLAMQDTTKTIFLILSDWNISIVVTAMKKQKTKEIMMWMTKTHFSTFNRLNFYFQIIHSIIPELYSCGFDAARDLCLLFRGLLRLNILKVSKYVRILHFGAKFY